MQRIIMRPRRSPRRFRVGLPPVDRIPVTAATGMLAADVFAPMPRGFLLRVGRMRGFAGGAAGPIRWVGRTAVLDLGGRQGVGFFLGL